MDEMYNLGGLGIIIKGSNENDGNLTTLNENFENFASSAAHLECVEENNAQDMYFSTGVIFRPLNPDGTYANMIELINLNPTNGILDSEDNNPTIYELQNGGGFTFTTDPLASTFTSNVNTDIQYLQLICNENASSEFIDINHFVPLANEAVNEDCATNKEDDDVIFVGEYAANADTPNQSSPVQAAKKRRKRKNFGEKRKNPVRRAQLEKASVDLVEKMSIPASVFNARVSKNKRPKPPTVVDQKNVRQSCRTTGAILQPPSPLAAHDYREWPVCGMHERPFYNEVTKTLDKFDFVRGEQSVATNTTALPETPNVCMSLSKQKMQYPNDDFTMLTNSTLKMLLDYSREVKEVEELSQEGHCESKGQRSSKGPLQKVAAILRDACVLYELASGVDNQALTQEIVNRIDAKES